MLNDKTILTQGYYLLALSVTSNLITWFWSEFAQFESVLSQFEQTPSTDEDREV